MNSVMDDSRLLTLPSNERIRLLPHMKARRARAARLLAVWLLAVYVRPFACVTTHTRAPDGAPSNCVLHLTPLR